MKTVGIIGRAYRNIKEQPIIQTSEVVRHALSYYDNIVPITLLPTGSESYCDIRKNSDEFSDIDKKKIDHIIKQCDGFIAPGGRSWFNFDNHIIKHAIKEDKPLLAICAGFQCLCSLYSDKKRPRLTTIEGGSHHSYGKDYCHTNYISEDTYLHKIIKSNHILVNSVHYYKVNFPMHDLVINAHSVDGVIEGVELPNKKFIIGVQWHPEFFRDDPSVKLFNAFVKNL